MTQKFGQTYMDSSKSFLPAYNSSIKHAELGESPDAFTMKQISHVNVKVFVLVIVKIF